MYKNKNRNINIYLFWPIVSSVLLFFLTIIISNISKKAGFVVFLCFLIISIINIYIVLNRNLFFKYAITKFLISATKFSSRFLKEIGIPFVISDTKGIILWANDKFFSLGQEFLVKKNIGNFFKDLSPEILSNIGDEKVNILAAYKNLKFNLHLKSIDITDLEGFEFLNIDKQVKDNEKLIFIYFENKTNFYEIKEELDNAKNVIGLIYIDNYDEVTEGMEDSKASMILAVVDRKLTRYISNNGGIIKKLEKDKYFFVTDKKSIEQMMTDRFSIVDETKEILAGDNLPLTLSIGIGYEGKSIESNNDLARLAMDMALGRGGDQVVIKKGQEVMFFGGKSASTASSARVKARVKAISFREILDTKDRVLVMGHENCDLDSFGSSIGVYIMAKHVGKKVSIVQNSLTKVVEELKEKFKNNENYPSDMFVDGATAIELMDENTLLVLVDHNTPNISDERRLVEMANSIVVFDHHRIQTSSITESLISYIEASASSASEMVCEIIKFFDENIKLKPLEAESMLSGIMLDTLNFTYHTTAKTFDAASFLKKFGADTDRVRKLLRVDLKNEEIKNQAISNTEFYKEYFAIAVLPENETIEKQVIAAKVANELIDIKNVKASIVIYKDKGKFAMSSRSIDEVNVQVLMEKLGGGGHRSQAGSKVEASDVEDVKQMIKNAIDDMIEKKEIE